MSGNSAAAQKSQSIFDQLDVAAVDARELELFAARLFGSARPGEGFLCLRTFPNKQGGFPDTDWVKFGEADQTQRIVAMANDAARRPAGETGRVFSPPVALFELPAGEHLKGSEARVVFAPAIVVDLDADPATGLAKLEAVIGPASLVVESGGVWQGVPKVHAYWILHEPARDRLRQAHLKLARRYARSLVGGDPTADALAHPMRWPGSLHTKTSTKRLVRIVANRPERQIDLDEATARLHDALAAAGIEVDGARLEPAQPRSGFTTVSPLDERTLAMLAERIPNSGLHWNGYRTAQMAFYDASHGDAAGLEALHQWAEKDERYKPDEVDASWAHFRMSPPSLVSDRTLINALRTVDPVAADAIVAQWWHEPVEATPLAPEKATALEFVTEIRMADAFSASYANRIRYAHDIGAWFVWTGVRFERAGKGLVAHWAARYAKESVSGAKADVKKTSEKSNFVRGVLTFAKDDPRIAAAATEWDADPYLAGVPEGVLDLRTGMLRSASPSDGITRQLGATPSIDAWCPRWRQFLDEATGGDKEVIRFLQQFAGYCLTGSTKEHALLFLFGDGGNGKGVFLNTVSRLLGDYAKTSAMETFIDNRYEGHSTNLAFLNGARLVTASETQHGRAWNEARIKAVTGGDPITARLMRENNFTFEPEFKLVIIGNHKPVLHNVDDAARRRFAMVPFVRKPTRVDRDLEAKLRDEAPGILRWMIEGCLDWQRNGLKRPAIVIAETENYFDTQDVFGQWLEECVEPCGSDVFMPTVRLYKAWADFAKSANESPGSSRAFTDKITAKGFSPMRKNSGRGFKGIRFRSANSNDGDAVTLGDTSPYV